MSTLQLFKNFPTTKEDISVCVKNAKDEILSGDFNPLEIDLHLKKMEELVKGIREDSEIKTAVFTELEKYVEKTVKIAGCEITKKGLTSYNYDLCNDVELRQMEAKAKILSEQIKDQKIKLQKMKEEQTIVTQDGEILTIYPAEKSVKDSFSIKIL
jgi:pyruvate/2-oxoglutarate dehydrogenase complex dihydrolipoamide acyltransferase (E2) component